MIKILALTILCFAVPVVLGSFSKVKEEYDCGSISNNFCCKTDCKGKCGDCSNDDNDVNKNCCSITLVESDKICGDEVKAPCVIDFNSINNKFESLKESNDDSDDSDKKNKKDDKKKKDDKDKKDKKDKKNGLDSTINWFKHLNTAGIILVSIAAFVVLLILIYSCCFFGKKDPPVPYAHIVDLSRD